MPSVYELKNILSQIFTIIGKNVSPPDNVRNQDKPLSSAFCGWLNFNK